MMAEVRGSDCQEKRVMSEAAVQGRVGLSERPAMKASRPMSCSGVWVRRSCSMLSERSRFDSRTPVLLQTRGRWANSGGR